MERTNYLKQVRDEKRAVENRLDALKDELRQANSDFEVIQAEYDSALMGGDEKKTDSILNRLQKQILKRDGLKRVIEDIEVRILPSFPEKEKQARDTAKKAATEEIRPLHEVAKAEIENLLGQINAIIGEFVKEANAINGAWGSSGADHLERFLVKMPTLTKNRLSFENELLREAYHPSAGYNPVMGAASPMKEAR